MFHRWKILTIEKCLSIVWKARFRGYQCCFSHILISESLHENNFISLLCAGISTMPGGSPQHAQSKWLEFTVIIFNMSCHTEVIVVAKIDPMILSQSQIPFVSIQLLDFFDISFSAATAKAIGGNSFIHLSYTIESCSQSTTKQSQQWIGQFVWHLLQHFVSEFASWLVVECRLMTLLGSIRKAMIFKVKCYQLAH